MLIFSLCGSVCSWWPSGRSRTLFARSRNFRTYARSELDSWRAASERIVAVFAKWTPPERGKVSFPRLPTQPSTSCPAPPALTSMFSTKETRKCVFLPIEQGIASEDAVSEEFLNSENSVDEKSRREWVDSDDGGKRYEERGIEMGENGYRCRWLLTGK